MQLWTLVIPLKPLVRAKSRLSGAAGEGVRPGLALAFAQDTVAAAVACPCVGGVVVVTDDARASDELAALGARITPDTPRSGLNAALSHGTAVVRAQHPNAAVAALNADLPALRPGDLARVLTAAGAFPRAFLPDAAGVGTTLLAALPGWPLSPAFGTDSRTRHAASGARELNATGVDSVTHDVDTVDDLRLALALGVGRHTRAATEHLLPTDCAAGERSPGGT